MRFGLVFGVVCSQPWQEEIVGWLWRSSPPKALCLRTVKAHAMRTVWCVIGDPYNYSCVGV